MIGGKGLGGDNTPKTKIIGIDAGGLTSSLTKKRVGGKKQESISIRSSAERQGLVGNIAATFPEQAALLGDLRARVAPGVSELRASRLAGLEDARRRTVGNLRDNLARRKVLGSSFASDALSRANIEFAREEDRINAESFLTELDLTQKIAAAEFEAKRAEFDTTLQELNLQAGIATQLATQATAEFNANARVGAQLDLAQQGMFLETIGTIAGFALSDKRLKENIRRVGQTDEGLPIYVFNYIGDNMTRMGVMAQDALIIQPDIVAEHDGVLAVDYSKVA